MRPWLLTLLLLPLLCTCDRAPEKAEQMAEKTAISPYAERVAAATERLSATPAGVLVLAAIDAHGGLADWYARSPLYYRFNYRPVDTTQVVRDSRILNDYVGARAVHTPSDQPGITYGFDGTEAWKHPADADLAVNARFWALTPYYFVGLPFVLADEGIFFAQLPDAERAGTRYQRVKVTYAEGVGDADGDYYILWIHPDSKRVEALNYIVSYPAYFPDGGHLPEKLMVIDQHVTIDGIVLPAKYSTRWSSAPEVVTTRIEVSEYEFRRGAVDSDFAMPAGAEIVNDLAPAQ